MRLPSRKVVVATLSALALVYFLGSWLLLPRILQSQSERFISEKTGHNLTMDRLEFNPFKLALRLHNLRLTEADGKPLLSFKELLVDFSMTSIVRRAWTFDAIQLEGLEASVVVLPGDRLNWSALIESLQGKPEPAAPAAPLPRLDIGHLAISGSNIELADRRTSSAFVTRIQPLDVSFDELSTLLDDKGSYQLTARTDFGAKISWQGDMTLNPLAVGGNFNIEEVSLAKLAPLLKLPLRMAPLQGTAAMSVHYRLSEANGKIDLLFDQVEAKIAGLNIRTQQNAAPLLALDGVTLKGGRFDLRQRSVTANTIALTGGGVNLSRDAQGRLNVLDLLLAAETKPVKTPKAAPKTITTTPAATAPPSPSWHYRIDNVALSGMRVDFRDQTISPAAQTSLQNVSVSLDGINDKLDSPWPLRASFDAGAGGRFEVEGTLIAAKPAVDLQVKLTDLSLKAAQPYLGAATTLNLASGALSGAGRVRYGADGPSGTGFSGSATVSNLRLTEAGTKNDFMVWKTLSANKLDVSSDALQIDELALIGLDTRLIIAKDRTVNLLRVLHPKSTAPADAATPPVTTAATAPNGAPRYRVDIDRLRVASSTMEFADYSLTLPFGTRIHHLRGMVNGLSSRPGAPGQLTLDGQVDDFGLARAAGQVNLFDPTDFMDVKVVFRNIEMTRLTPYLATFAGRKIQSGKLSLDLDYKIKQRQLVGDNKVVMDQLTLGERVESPEAKDLPLDLAIALLQDADGRIDLGLPVSGSLDDPQFSFGGLVWKVIVNVLTKVATAPFRAIGAMFGGEQAGFDAVIFDPGYVRLAPPEREKLLKLAASLDKRPALALEVHGTYADIDRVALQDLQLRRAVADKAGYQVDAQRDPGPISTGQPKVQTALEDLFKERAGRGELAALKDAFRKANPGQLEESNTGKLLSRMTTMFDAKQDLSQSEVDKLKGADFHVVLYQRLRDKEVVPDERLQALAKARGEAALAELQAAKAPADRLRLAAPQKTDAVDNTVPLGIKASAVAKAPAG